MIEEALSMLEEESNFFILMGQEKAAHLAGLTDPNERALCIFEMQRIREVIELMMMFNTGTDRPESFIDFCYENISYLNVVEACAKGVIDRFRDSVTRTGRNILAKAEAEERYALLGSEGFSRMVERALEILARHEASIQPRVGLASLWNPPQ